MQRRTNARFHVALKILLLVIEYFTYTVMQLYWLATNGGRVPVVAVCILHGQLHGGDSRDLNDRVHGISCRYSDKTSKRTYHTILNNQPIFIKQSTHTSLLFEANVHLKVTPHCAVVFLTNPNKYCFPTLLGLLRKITIHCRKTPK